MLLLIMKSILWSWPLAFQQTLLHFYYNLDHIQIVSSTQIVYQVGNNHQEKKILKVVITLSTWHSLKERTNRIVWIHVLCLGVSNRLCETFVWQCASICGHSERHIEPQTQYGIQDSNNTFLDLFCFVF
jgi:hypothetical protein